MFRHLLVPLDGSQHSEQALPVAARLARASEGMITLVQVMDTTHKALSSSSPEALDERFTASRSYLEKLLQRPYLADLSIDMQVVSGNPAEAIASLAATSSIDLIILTSHGYTGVKRWIMGSVAEQIADNISTPVLVLHSQKPLHIHHNIDGTSFVRALVPLDISADSLAAIAPATRIVRAFSSPGQGEVHLAHIVIAPETEQMSETETRLQEARQQLEATGQRLLRDDPDLPVALTWAVTLESEIAEGIVRRAEHGEKQAETTTAQKYDLIVIPTRGSGSTRQAVGSVTRHVFHATRLPMLIIHPTDVMANKGQQDISQSSVASKDR